MLGEDYNQAKQEFAKASLSNYLTQKKDYGVLYIDISKDPFIFIFFRNNEELNEAGFRLDISTQYLVTYDTQRVAAQFTVVPSSRLSAEKLQTIIPTGTNKKPNAKPTASTGAAMSKIQNWVMQFAGNRNVTDPKIQQQITNTTYELAKQDLSAADIVKNLEKTYPVLKVTKTSKKK